MQQPIVIVGIGEMGAVFAHALLRSGRPVFPILRSTDPAASVEHIPDPELVLVTVGEDDLDPALAALPAAWRNRVGLIQNELLPRDWARHGIESPTVAAVWFEKKPGRAPRVIIPTPIAGPRADLLAGALRSIHIAADVLDQSDLIDTLVAKNLYILTTNITGLRTGGTVSELWRDHHTLAVRVAGEVLDIQERLVGSPLDREHAIDGMLTAFGGDPDHGATGRSAPRRLQRAIDHAAEAGLEIPTLLEIGREAGLSV
ncbi:MAG: hypothetical protein ABFS21_01040 [Actinomycetota bacterium]